MLLQSATVITKCDNFITKCDDYYKVRQYIPSLDPPIFFGDRAPPYLEAAYSVSGDKEQEKFHSEFMTTGGKLLFSFAG